MEEVRETIVTPSGIRITRTGKYEPYAPDYDPKATHRVTLSNCEIELILDMMRKADAEGDGHYDSRLFDHLLRVLG